MSGGQRAAAIHVLHVIAGLGAGGAEHALVRFVTASQGDAFRHSVVALTPGGRLAAPLAAAGVDVLELDLRTAPLRTFLRLVAHMRHARPGIVQTWMYHADLVGGLAARLAGCRRVVWGVRATELTDGDARSTRWIRRWCARLSSSVPMRIVCVAEAARRAHQRDGYADGAMVVIPNGFDVEWFAPDDELRAATRRAAGIAPGEIVVGTAGRFNAAKDPGNFVAAAALVAAQCPEARFLLAGRGFEPGNDEFMRLLRSSGCAGRFIALGERADLKPCFAAMDVFCLSSRAEAFPNVVGEAMCMALPCVVTDVGDAATLVGDAGIVVPREDPAALAAAVVRLVRAGADQRRDAGRRARARIVAGYTLRRSRERFESLYRELIAGDGA